LYISNYTRYIKDTHNIRLNTEFGHCGYITMTAWMGKISGDSYQLLKSPTFKDLRYKVAI